MVRRTCLRISGDHVYIALLTSIVFLHAVIMNVAHPQVRTEQFSPFDHSCIFERLNKLVLARADPAESESFLKHKP